MAMDAAPLPSFDENHGIDPSNVPVHVACVMDGNGRWAHQRDLARKDGHMAGERALSDVVEGAIEVGVKWLTAYAFSTENWTRPTDEVEFLMQFNEDVIARRSGELHEQGVRLIFAGRRGFPVPDSVGVAMDDAMTLTANNERLTLTVAFNYGGRAEIVDAVRALVRAGVAADDIDEAAIREHLYVRDMPDVDLLIRTSNEFRISNFLLWQIAYGELYFTETLWPDFNREHLFTAIREYQGRQRRFGGR
jgi:undecaprenyl diphosphate synthase